MNYRYLFLLSFLLLQGKVYCQNSTEGKTIESAEQAYLAGLYKQSIQNLSADTINTLSKENRIKAYELLVKNYIELKEIDSAHMQMKEYLKENPLFNPSEENVPDDFIFLKNNFKVWPFLQIGVSAGFNILRINQPNTFPIYQGENYSEAFSYSFENSIGFNVIYNFTNKLGIGTSLNLMSYSYNKRANFNEETTQYKEVFSLIEVPLNLRYQLAYIKKRKLRVMLKGGLTYSFLNETNGEITLSTTSNEFEVSDFNKFPFLSNIDRSIDRSNTMLGMLVGGEVLYQLKKFNFSLGINYQQGLDEFTVEEQSPTTSNSDLAYYFYHSDGSFKINRINISASVRYSFYKVKSKNKKR